MFLLGRLYEEDEDFEAAKSQFEMSEMSEMSEMLGDGERSKEAKDAPAAYYLLSGYVKKTDPKLATSYMIKAAEMGHETAQFIVEEEGLTVD